MLTCDPELTDLPLTTHSTIICVA